MNINLPHHIVMKLLIESETFREYVIDNCINQEPIKGIEFYRKLVRKQFPDLKNQKIPAIKWIRDHSRNNEDVLRVFSSNGYECYGEDKVCGHPAILALSAAKHFVESC